MAEESKRFGRNLRYRQTQQRDGKAEQRNPDNRLLEGINNSLARPGVVSVDGVSELTDCLLAGDACFKAG